MFPFRNKKTETALLLQTFAYPENWALLYEAPGIYAFSPLSTVFLFQPLPFQHISFVPKTNAFLSIIPPISHNFVKGYGAFNIIKSFCVRRQLIFEVS